MRLAQAPAPTFTDAASNYKKARALFAGEQQGQRAVVNLEFKPTGASAINTRASLTPTHPGLADAPKLASSLSLGPPVKASNGTDNEHNVSTKADSDNRGTH